MRTSNGNPTINNYIDINKFVANNLIAICSRYGVVGEPIFVKVEDIEGYLKLNRQHLNIMLFKWKPDNYSLAYVKGRSPNQIKFIKDDTIPESKLKAMRRCSGLRFSMYVKYTINVACGLIKTWSHE